MGAKATPRGFSRKRGKWHTGMVLNYCPACNQEFTRQQYFAAHLKSSKTLNSCAQAIVNIKCCNSIFRVGYEFGEHLSTSIKRKLRDHGFVRVDVVDSPLSSAAVVEVPDPDDVGNNNVTGKRRKISKSEVREVCLCVDHKCML